MQVSGVATLRDCPLIAPRQRPKSRQALEELNASALKRLREIRRGIEIEVVNQGARRHYRRRPTEVDLTDANLTGADLAGADLTRAILTGAVLTGAVPTDTHFAEVDPPANLHSRC
ncbi:pentapeptide repeat-containing protein [Tunturiibacter gelidiferens]|uniref:pentapeptide repeat-containing protein n=1 Tax=Tunturiibacter gelidiferens TaxID=3069689 RepID=UPI003D9AEF6C